MSVYLKRHAVERGAKPGAVAGALDVANFEAVLLLASPSVSLTLMSAPTLALRQKQINLRVKMICPLAGTRACVI